QRCGQRLTPTPGLHERDRGRGELELVRLPTLPARGLQRFPLAIFL
ncbi:MAG: hypothetical protein HUU28_06305, partial [Planctomycetaceae bacterium]|nr:hypothetical protein [Planctomycetaceae bacterium]